MDEVVKVREDDLTGGEIIALVREHLENMHAVTPTCSIHALDLSALRSPTVTFWSIWDGDDLVGCGALKAICTNAGEIKSMRTAESHRGRGVASRMLEHILHEARGRGYERLFLETGAMGAFAPARSLYAKYGFTTRGPFGDYADDPNSVFMEKVL